ncbi:ABC transporter permease [Natronospora cellulosivora (SeqCode)]
MNTLSNFKNVFEMQFRRSSGYIVFFALIQIMMSLGILIGFTYFMPENDPYSILFLATGAPTLILIMTGLVILPQQIGTGKAEGYHEFSRSWPVNRAIILLADTTLWIAITIPGIVISALVAYFHYDMAYSISFSIVPVFFLIALTAIGVGYGIAYLLPPNAAHILTQLIVFAALMFSPINFPMDRLPQWLQTVHSYLPMYSMAEVMRASLASATFTASIGNYMNLVIWCLLGYGGAIFILNRAE